MLRIRFSRVGKKNAPSFRLVLTPKTSPPKGKFLEILGFYNPRTKEKGFQKERILQWISKGAQPSDTAHNFLVKEGVIEGKKVSVHSRAQRKKKETADSSTEASAKEEKVPAATEETQTEGESPAEETPTAEGAPTETPADETPKEETPNEEESAPVENAPKEEEVSTEEASPVSDSPSEDPSGTPSADESTNGIDKE